MSREDIAARRSIVTDFSTTLFVDAGAGSGKTTAMIARIVMLIIRGMADIREIVAITFTNEGAASLTSRIRQELERAYTEKSYAPSGEEYVMLMEEELERIRAAIGLLPIAPFTTMHGFCLSLLKERPVEAGIDPAITMNTAGNIVPVLHEAWTRFLLDRAAADDPFIRYAVAHAVTLDDVESMAALQSAHPDLDIYTEDVEAVTDAAIEKTFAEASGFVSALAENIRILEGDTGSAAGRRRLQSVRDAHASLLLCDSPGTKATWLLAQAEWPSWPAKLGEHAQQAGRLLALASAFRERYLNHQHGIIVRFIREFTGWFRRVRRETSSLDFDDLLFLTRELLRTNRDVRSYFKGRFRYVLVDETQDTDPLQMEIVFFLAEGKETHAERWSDVRLEPGKLFVVGDPKQSIYKFRRADIAMYDEARQTAGRQGGRLLTLDRNFRSAGAIIEFVNRHFAGSFASFQDGIAEHIHPAYVPLTAAAPVQSSMHHHVFVISTPDAGKAASKIAFLGEEIRKVLSFIHWLTGANGPLLADPLTGGSRRAQFSDIMILMRAMTDFPVYERMFEEAGIPHQQIGGKTFFDAEDIRGLVFGLKAVDDPNDTVALFGSLKSPVFGFSDQELVDFCRGGHRLSIFSGRGEGEDPLHRALDLFRTLHAAKETLRPSGVLKELLNGTGIAHVVLTEANGLQKSARYFRFLELVHEAESVRSRSFRGVVEAITAIMDLEDPQLASITLTPAGENAVRFMSIHKAKGLESPVVILAHGKGRPMKASDEYFVLRDEGTIVIPYRKHGGYYSLDRAGLLGAEQRREECENERLRYVAATRARDVLVLCIPSEEEGQDTFNGHFGPSCILNPLVQPYHEVAYDVPAAAPGQVVDLAERYAEVRTVQEERVMIYRAGQEQRRSLFKSVHDLMETDTDVFKRKRLSRGKPFGRVLHRIMEYVVATGRDDVEGVLDAWMEEEGVRPGLREDLLAICGRLRRHPTVEAALRAERRYCEWEFLVPVGKEILAGIIDLVFLREDGWVIVDYKTDDISDPGRKAELDALYARQVEGYAQAFTAVTGEPVVGTIVLYADQAS